MSPRSEEFLARARERVLLARAALDGGFSEGALSAAYYAMLYAARAALSEEDRYAKTHRGTWSLLRESFVETGRFDRELFEQAQRTQRVREAADYDAETVPVAEAEEVVAQAERFVSAVGELLGG